MEKAQKEINDLRGKLKEYETKIIEMQSASISKIENANQNNLSQTMMLMQVDQTGSADNNRLDTSLNSNSGITTLAQLKDGSSEFTVVFLKD